MLYDSTKNLLQSILQSLETGDETLWDDQTESGNACLYEMHQMSGRLYKAYKSDSLNAHSVVQSSLPEKLNRAMPHVRTMVIAIRNKDQTRALESGKAALAEMNGNSPAAISGGAAEPKTETREGPLAGQQEKAGGKQGLVVEDRKSSRQAPGAKRDCQ
jgi:hypothetical protein